MTPCDHTDCSPPSPSVNGIFQARILEEVAVFYSRDLSNPGIEPESLVSPALGRWILYYCAAWEALKSYESESEVAQLCPTLCDPMDCSIPGFSVHEILQARVLEWGAIAFSRGSS